MNLDLRSDPAYRQLRETIARLELISHVSGTSYDARAPRATDDEPGGRRPPGGSFDKPRRPRADATEPEIDEYEAEMHSWFSSYQRRTSEYFVRELERCHSRVRLERLVQDALESLDCWRKQPASLGGIEPERGSFFWKCQIADEELPVERIVERYRPISRATVYRYRLKYRGLRTRRAA